HRLHFRIALLDVALGEAGVVAAKLVVVAAEGRAVDGGSEENGERLPFGGIDAQDGHAAVGQTARIDAEDNAVRRELSPVHHEMDDPASPGQPSRLETFCGLYH